MYVPQRLHDSLFTFSILLYNTKTQQLLHVSYHNVMNQCETSMVTYNNHCEFYVIVIIFVHQLNSTQLKSNQQ